MATDNEFIDEIKWTNKFYNDAREYWSNIDATVDGMLGGFEHVSDDDVAESQEFLQALFKVGFLRIN